MKGRFIFRKKWSDRTMLFTAFVVVLLSYIVVAAFYPMQYYTHDETDIQNTLSGCFSGSPFPSHPYISVLLGWVLAGLYSVLPAIQWWYVYGTILLVLGMLMIFYSILKVADCVGISPVTAIILVLAIDCTFTVYLVANSAYTLIGAVFGTGLCSGFFWLEKCSKKTANKYFILCFFGYILIHIYRKETGEAILCFLLLSILYYLYRTYGMGKRMVLIFLAISAVFVAVTSALLVFKRHTDNIYHGEQYEEFFDAWRGCRDNPFDTYEDNPQMYEEAGWSEYEYWMFRSYRGTSEKMTTESYNYIHDHSAYVTAYRRIIYENIGQAFRSDEFKGILFGYIALVLIALCALLYNFNLPYLLFMLFCNGGFMVMSAYLVLLRGRFLYRSAYVIFLPAMIIDILLIMRQRREDATCKIGANVSTYKNSAEYTSKANNTETATEKCSTDSAIDKTSTDSTIDKTGTGDTTDEISPAASPAGISLCIVAAVLVYITCITISAISLYGYFKDIGKRREALERCRLITAYEMDHKDQAFICLGDTYENFDAMTTFPGDKPVNNLYGFTFRWAACVKQLEINNLGTESEILQFTADHTRILTDWDMSKKTDNIRYNNSFYCYLDYLKEFYGCKGFVETGVIPGTNVHIYRYLFGDAADEYDVIYDIVDGSVKTVENL